MADVNPAYARIVATALRLRALLDASEEAQWQAGRTVRPREDTTERSKGTTSDPTFGTVADERRLQLRARVLEAEAAMDEGARAMQRAERHLAEALDGWHG